ncbi:MAG: glycerophosphodiester phosphodiesterase [Candidatus Heimdallarchaeota archaeon]
MERGPYCGGFVTVNIAHRGGAGLAPENTLACFKRGIQYADMLEFDVQPTADRQLVVFHDRSGIERTTNGHGLIPNLTFEYLRSLDAGGWFGSEFIGEKIPTLAEVLDFAKETEVQLNIELKYYDDSSDWFERAIINTIGQYKITQSTIVTARYPANIRRIQRISPQLRCILLQKERPNDEYLALTLELDLKTMQIRRQGHDPMFIQKCHDHDIRVYYYYADDPNDMRNAVEMRLDGILTNYPDRLAQVLTETS